MTAATTEPIVAFSRDVLGFDPFPRQADILEEIYRDGIRTAVLRLGRRAGKGRIASVVATFEATVNADAHLAAVLPGEQVAIAVISRSQKLARVVHRYISTYLSRSTLGVLVVRETIDEIELSNGVVILTLPCHAASVRGQAVAVVILDEAAWWTGVDGSPLDPEEVWSAIVPATAQFPAGRVIVMSTPRWSIGWFAELFARAASGRYDDMRAWHASTAEMNPSIPASFLQGEMDKDPANYKREYLAEFESGIGALFDEVILRAAIRARGDLEPSSAYSYRIALDAAFTGDRFTAVVGHRESERGVIVDTVRGWQGSKAAPVLLDPTLDEIAMLARTYRGARVTIDQFAAEPIRQGLNRRGVDCQIAAWTNDTKLDAATEMRRLLIARQLSIPDHRDLIRECLTLEQRSTPSGLPRIAAPGRSHDDYATALLALILDLAGLGTDVWGGSFVAGDTGGGHSTWRRWN